MEECSEAHCIKRLEQPQHRKKHEQLQKRDSGYYSPVTPSNTPGNTTNGKQLSLTVTGSPAAAAASATNRSNSSPASVGGTLSNDQEFTDYEADDREMQTVVRNTTTAQGRFRQQQTLRKQLSMPGDLDQQVRFV